MLSINQMTANEQLFTELTLEEGANISGGLDYKFRNRADAIFPFTFNGVSHEVAPLSELVVQSNFDQAVIAYDQIIGPGYVVDAKVVRPGTTSIDRQGNTFLVIPANTAGVPPAAAIASGNQPPAAAIGGLPPIAAASRQLM